MENKTIKFIFKKIFELYPPTDYVFEPSTPKLIFEKISQVAPLIDNISLHDVKQICLDSPVIQTVSFSDDTMFTTVALSNFENLPNNTLMSDIKEIFKSPGFIKTRLPPPEHVMPLVLLRSFGILVANQNLLQEIMEENGVTVICEHFKYYCIDIDYFDLYPYRNKIREIVGMYRDE